MSGWIIQLVIYLRNKGKIWNKYSHPTASFNLASPFGSKISIFPWAQYSSIMRSVVVRFLTIYSYQPVEQWGYEYFLQNRWMIDEV